MLSIPPVRDRPQTTTDVPQTIQMHNLSNREPVFPDRLHPSPRRGHHGATNPTLDVGRISVVPRRCAKCTGPCHAWNELCITQRILRICDIQRDGRTQKPVCYGHVPSRMVREHSGGQTGRSGSRQSDQLPRGQSDYDRRHHGKVSTCVPCKYSRLTMIQLGDRVFAPTQRNGAYTVVCANGSITCFSMSPAIKLFLYVL